MILTDKKTVNAWCMYDWANSVYSLVITTAVFPAYYEEVTKGADESGIVNFFGLEVLNSVLYSYALSLSFLITVLIVPLLSGIADSLGNKKLFMKVFVYLGSLACMSLYFFEGNNVELGIIGSMTASIGFSASLVFYDAFLPEIATGNDADRVSARGYSLGYIGSVLLLVLILVMVNFHESFGFGNSGEAVRISFLMVGLWWMGFSQIPFFYLSEKKKVIEPGKGLWLSGYRELQKVWRRLGDLPGLRLYLGAYFFYNTGVQTTIVLATIFAAEVLEMEQSLLILTILIIQLVAIAGATMFARLSGRIGNKHTLMVMITIWIVITILAYFVQTDVQFMVLAFFVGLVLGGIQSMSRSTYSRMIPQDSDEHTAFFSFYDVTYYISYVVGTFSFGFFMQLTGNMRVNALVLATWFIIGLGILSFLRYDFRKEAGGSV